MPGAFVDDLTPFFDVAGFAENMDYQGRTIQVIVDHDGNQVGEFAQVFQKVTTLWISMEQGADIRAGDQVGDWVVQSAINNGGVVEAAVVPVGGGA